LAILLLAWAAFVFFGILLGVAIRVIVWRILRSHGYWVVSLATAGTLAIVLNYPLMAFIKTLGINQRVPGHFELFLILFSLGLGVSALGALWSDTLHRGPLIRCSVSDHYVLVVTEAGEERLLMRFSDALSELDGVKGIRVHRSHWVALDAVTSHANENGRMFLMAKDGARIPVSRNYRDQVQTALSA